MSTYAKVRRLFHRDHLSISEIQRNIAKYTKSSDTESDIGVKCHIQYHFQCHTMAKNLNKDAVYRAAKPKEKDCWRRLKIDHPYRLKIDQGELLYSVLYSIEIVDQTELVLSPFFY